jgi:hypothetical protein
MGALAIRQKLHEYIRIADDKKVKAIYTMIESDLDKAQWYNDETLLDEWDNDYEKYKSGKEKGYTLAEVKKHF